VLLLLAALAAALLFIYRLFREEVSVVEQDLEKSVRPYTAIPACPPKVEQVLRRQLPASPYGSIPPIHTFRKPPTLPCNISMTDLVLGKPIGNGAFGGRLS
jgi:hypothetical protein